MRASLVAIVMVSWVSAGCLGLTPPEGVVACEDGRCPQGWFCRADRRCHRTPDPSLDGSVDATSVDASADASDAPSLADAGLDVGLDASAPLDVGVDAGVAIDAASPDAFAMDARPDDDAWAEDAWVTPDEGLPDGGRDAGPPPDAWAPDTGCGGPSACPPATRPNMVATCVLGACGVACAATHVDLDGASGNGCEYACTITSAMDAPDGVDANCDGADGVVGATLFASPAGSTTADGLDPGNPVTLERALLLASMPGRPTIVLATIGDYRVTGALVPSSLALHGDYTADFRGRSASSSSVVLAPGARAVIVGTGVRFESDGVDYRSVDQSSVGASTATMFVQGGALVLSHATIYAGRGGPGAAGGPGVDRSGTGPSGGDGGEGTSAAAGSGAGTGVGSGGAGALAPGDCLGDTGQPGECGAAGSGGTCAMAACVCSSENQLPGTSGGSGTTGCSGGIGSHGAGGSGPGTLGAAGWTGALAGAGGTGVTGGRGGGGGGGAGSRCTDFGMTLAAGGGGGGQGGGGGVGGGGGAPGGAGGASIAILAFGGSVSLDGVVLTTGGGGDGGRGGAGGVGQAGGAGGRGGAGESRSHACGGPTHVIAGRGGDGGSGGTGGVGGCGGGGAGGPSIGVALGGGAVLVGEAGTTFSLSASGAGGASCPGGNPGGRFMERDTHLFP